MPIAATQRPLDRLLTPSLAAALDRLDLVSRKIFAGKLPGERRAKRRGRSVEFDDYRLYVPGDDLRHIDWNVLARLDRFFIKLFREDQDLALHLVVDASDSMDTGEPNKLLFAHQLAMALGYVGLVNHNRVALHIFRGPGRPLVQLAPVRGKTNAVRLADTLLASLDPASRAESSTLKPGADFNTALRQVALTRTGRGVLVLISDFLHREGWTPGLDYLAGTALAGFDTFVIQVLSPGELDPAAENIRGDLRLTDIETAHAAEVTVSPALLAAYKKKLGVLTARLRTDCRARGLAYALVPTSTDLQGFVLNTLRRTGLLR